MLSPPASPPGVVDASGSDAVPASPKSSPTDQDLQFVKRFVLRTSAVDVVVDENGSPREPRDNGGLSARESGASTISALSDSRRSPVGGGDEEMGLGARNASPAKKSMLMLLSQEPLLTAASVLRSS